MSVHRVVALLAVSIGFLTFPTSPALADADEWTPPDSVELTVDRPSVTWPSGREFSYRLTVTAGGQDARFLFTPEMSGWGISGVSGTPIRLRGATLDGPGTLSPYSTLIADPSPTACFRGGFQSNRTTWQLTVPATESTTVNLPASLLGARLEGMDASLKITLDQGGAPGSRTLTAPVRIEGPEGVRIVTDPGLRRAKIGQRFILSGHTVPVVAGRRIAITAEPRRWRGRSGQPQARVIATMTTDKHGHFRSGPTHLQAAASWVLTSRLTAPAPYDGEATCNGAVEVTDGSWIPTGDDLDGHRFTAIRVKGRKVKPKRVRFNFRRIRRFSPNVPHVKDWPVVPGLVPHAGCNRMSGEYRIRDGRIRMVGFRTTLMLCRPNHDRWLQRILTKGARVSMRGETLTLKRGKWTIVLRRVTRG